MHRKGASALEPELVAGAPEQLQESEAISGRAVAKARALRERARVPGQLAACDQQALVLVVTGRDLCQARDHPRRPMAPLRANRPVATDQLRVRERGPVREPVFFDRKAFERLARAQVQLLVRLVDKGRDTARKTVRCTEKLPRGAV